MTGCATPLCTTCRRRGAPRADGDGPGRLAAATERIEPRRQMIIGTPEGGNIQTYQDHSRSTRTARWKVGFATSPPPDRPAIRTGLERDPEHKDRTVGPPGFRTRCSGLLDRHRARQAVGRPRVPSPYALGTLRLAKMISEVPGQIPHIARASRRRDRAGNGPTIGRDGRFRSCWTGRNRETSG
jgi:hypothetical protein